MAKRYKPRQLTTLLVRLYSKITIQKTTQCWEFNGSRGQFGHGQIAKGGYGPAGRKLTSAHRASWEVTHGPIPAGLCVLHKCDNPPCINPDHLMLGTKAANTADMIGKGRMKTGADLPHAKLTPQQITEIRSAVGITQRELSKDYGVSQGAISMIRSGKRWSHQPC